MQLHRQRVEWLTSGPRRAFGAVYDRRVWVVLHCTGQSGARVLREAVAAFVQHECAQLEAFTLVAFAARPARAA